MTIKTAAPRIAAIALALATGLTATSAWSQARDGVPPTPITTATAFPDLVTGEQIYKGVCQACHMPEGQGAAGAGAYPALAKNQNIGTAAYPITVLIKGQKAMPVFGDMLSDDQVAGVVGYIRTSFGNKYKAKVTPAEVAEIRKTIKPQGAGE